MAETNTVTGAFNPTNYLDVVKAQQAAKGNEQIFSSKSFLQLLGAQMKSQNPLEPLKDTEFVAQMAQFSQLEQVTSLASSMKALNMTSQLSQGAALIGRQVSYVPEGTDVPVTGTVEKMVMENSGKDAALVINGIHVGLSQVREVR